MRRKLFLGYNKTMMSVIGSLLHFLYAMPAMAPEGFAENTENKLRGVANAAIRTSVGIYETDAFFVLLPKDNEPVKNPEYVWRDWD